MKYDSYDITFKEVPGHIALVFSISNCQGTCEGCHSPHLREDIGTTLDMEEYERILALYEPLIDAVCFLGGSQYWREIKPLLERSKGLHRCLYSGSSDISEVLKNELESYKVGAFTGKPLTDPMTNQIYYVKQDNEWLNKTEIFHAS